MSHRLESDLIIEPGMTFEDVKIPDAMRRVIDTGHPHFNALFTGSGIRPSTCGLITGGPGVGKTTIALILANSLAKMGNCVLYNSCEEHMFQLKMNVERMNLSHLDKIKIGNIYDAKELIEFAKKTKALEPEKDFITFVDSKQTIELTHEGRGRPMTQANQSVEALWMFTAFCKETMACMFLIGQVTKDDVFAGKQEEKHALDYHMHLSVEKDKDSDMYEERKATVLKNRFGLTDIPFYYATKRSGIIWLVEPPLLEGIDNDGDDEEE